MAAGASIRSSSTSPRRSVTSSNTSVSLISESLESSDSPSVSSAPSLRCIVSLSPLRSVSIFLSLWPECDAMENLPLRSAAWKITAFLTGAPASFLPNDLVTITKSDTRRMPVSRSPLPELAPALMSLRVRARPGLGDACGTCSWCSSGTAPVLLRRENAAGKAAPPRPRGAGLPTPLSSSAWAVLALAAGDETAVTSSPSASVPRSTRWPRNSSSARSLPPEPSELAMLTRRLASLPPS
mmetsp:Transcript_24103/g.83685  ORF Transcript_24103/g.83685 Transcript_24103/m.83685 type:complete len:240 (-) Transcript_24103:964-1683(-)